MEMQNGKNGKYYEIRVYLLFFYVVNKNISKKNTRKIEKTTMVFSYNKIFKYF